MKIDAAEFDREIKLRDAYRAMQRFLEAHFSRGEALTGELLAYAGEAENGSAGDPAALHDFLHAVDEIQSVPSTGRRQQTHRTRTTARVELTFIGSGTVVEEAPGHFHGGVPEPEMGPRVGFDVLQEEVDGQGNLSPASGGAQTCESYLQVNLWGDAHAFREVGRYLLSIAELDTTADPDFHQDHEVASSDGRTHVHLIVRKIPAHGPVADRLLRGEQGR